MKVALCATLDLAGTGGVEVHVRELARALIELGCTADVFGRTAIEHPAIHDLRRLAPERYDLIHTQGSAVSPGLLRRSLARPSRWRHVHTLHGVSADYLLNCRAWANWRCYVALLIEALASRSADHVIAVSRPIRQRARQCLGVQPQKITVIPNGFAPVAPPPRARQTVRQRLGLTADHTVVLFVGRGEDRVKGTAAIAVALEQLWRRRPNVRLLAVPGSGFAPAPWLCRSGPVPHDDMPAVYVAADVFVNASLNEGAPLTLIEAMAAGLAVVAAPVGGIPEVIRHEHSGLLLQRDRADLAPQLQRVIADEPLRQRLGENARQAVQPLSWAHVARQTLHVYERVLQPSRLGCRRQPPAPR